MVQFSCVPPKTNSFLAGTRVQTGVTMDASAQPFGFGNQQVSRDQKRRRTLTSYPVAPVGAAIKKGPLPPPPTPPPDVRQISRNERLILELAVSSINNMAVGGVLLNPLNVVRARLQVQSTIAPNTYNSIGHCLSTVAKEDGIRRLWLYGMRMSCFREFSYGGAQWGLYGNPSIHPTYSIESRGHC